MDFFLSNRTACSVAKPEFKSRSVCLKSLGHFCFSLSKERGACIVFREKQRRGKMGDSVLPAASSDGREPQRLKNLVAILERKRNRPPVRKKKNKRTGMAITQQGPEKGSDIQGAASVTVMVK